MWFSVLTRKGMVLRHHFHPLRSRSRLGRGRSQPAVPSRPGPQMLPAIIAVLTLPALRLFRWGQPNGGRSRGWVPQTATQAHCRCYQVKRQGSGRGSPPPQGLGPANGWPWWGLSSPAGHNSQLFSGPPRQPTPVFLPGESQGWQSL